MLDLKTYIDKGYSAKEVSHIIDIPVRRLHYLANKESLNFKRKSKYNIVYNRFTELLHSEETYYLLGYLFADGYINPRKGLINITSKDKEILEKISPLIGDLKINFNKYGSYYLQWYSKEHIKNLIDLGCPNKKSLILKYPTWLDSTLEHHFIRGYFDGDGSIGLYSRKDRNSKILSITIAGTKNFLLGIKSFINNKGSIRKLKNIHVLSFNGNLQADNFCKIIYKDSHIHMERKHNVYFKGFISYRHLIELQK